MQIVQTQIDYIVNSFQRGSNSNYKMIQLILRIDHRFRITVIIILLGNKLEEVQQLLQRAVDISNNLIMLTFKEKNKDNMLRIIWT